MIFDGSFAVLDRARLLYPKSCHYAMQSKSANGDYYFDPLDGQPALAIRGDNFLALFEIGADVPECFLGQGMQNKPLDFSGMFVTDERVPVDEIRLNAWDGPTLMKNIGPSAPASKVYAVVKISCEEYPELVIGSTLFWTQAEHVVSRLGTSAAGVFVDQEEMAKTLGTPLVGDDSLYKYIFILTGGLV